MNLTHQKTKESWCSFIHLNHLHLFGSTTSSTFLLFCRFHRFLRFERIEISEKNETNDFIKELIQKWPLGQPRFNVRTDYTTIGNIKLTGIGCTNWETLMEFWIRKSNIIEEDEDLSASQDLADFIENERQIKQGKIFIKITNGQCRYSNCLAPFDLKFYFKNSKRTPSAKTNTTSKRTPNTKSPRTGLWLSRLLKTYTFRINFRALTAYVTS